MIGILTFWGVPNYGAFAQAYSLNCVVNDLCPNKEVRHLAYLHPAHYDLYHRKPPVFSSWKSYLRPSSYRNLFRYGKHPLQSHPHFDADWEAIPHQTYRNAAELETFHFDIVITGSDAIWEYSIPSFGNDYHLMGAGLDCDHLIAYAPSFGMTDLSYSFPSNMCQWLNNYDYVSVRDENSQQICHALTKGEVLPQIVIDPTLLHDFQNDTNIPVSEYNDYILVYGNEFKERDVLRIQEYANTHHLTLLGAGIAPEWCEIRLTDVPPKQWMGLFSGATYVVTCTFHGLMFSAVYGKPFFFHQVEYVKNRSEWLLQQLGLGVFFDGKDPAKIFRAAWNFTDINQRLNSLRTESLGFLKRALEQCGG